MALTVGAHWDDSLLDLRLTRPINSAYPSQRNDTLEWAEPMTAARSLDLFDQFYDPDSPYFTAPLSQL
jgi:hypothetical protein